MKTTEQFILYDTDGKNYYSHVASLWGGTIWVEEKEEAAIFNSKEHIQDALKKHGLQNIETIKINKL
jgi:hypothetical protein